MARQRRIDDLLFREMNSLKILHHFQRLEALAKGKQIAPVTIEIDPVSYCNHACDWCVDPVHTNIRMRFDVFTKLINELSDFRIDGCGVEGIVFKGGGEPTLHPQFDLMVELTSELGFSIGVVTNGSQLQKYALSLAQQTAYIRVSLDGPTFESHQRIHHSQDFNRIIQGVSCLVEARDDQRHPVIGLSFAMDIHTVRLAEKAINLGESLGVDYVLLRPPFFEEVGRTPSMTTDEAQQVRQRLRMAANGYTGGMKVIIGNWISDREQTIYHQAPHQNSGRRDYVMDERLPIEHRTGSCYASPLLAVITADQHLYGCCNLRGLSSWSMGILDYDHGCGFADLWGGLGRADVYEKMRRCDCLPHCTHPVARYNEIIEVLKDDARPHSQFV